MGKKSPKKQPGQVRDAILRVLSSSSKALTVKQIGARVEEVIGPTSTSSVRSYLRLNTPDYFVRKERGVYRVNHEEARGIQRELRALETVREPFKCGEARLYVSDCFDWLET